MPNMLCKTKRDSDPAGKPRVYFTCHPADFASSFERVCQDLFATHDCAVFYTGDMAAPIPEQDRATDLAHHNLFVVPVTRRLLTEPNRAMDDDIPYAAANNIPVLPIMMEEGLDALYARGDRFGEMQYLKAGSNDETEITYPEKLKKHLESVLISSETAQRIRSAFDAYIFLSYRKKDRRYANELMRLIHRHPRFRDIAIWYDEFLTPGESFRKNIEKALASSKLFALLVTPSVLEEPEGKPNFVMAQEYPAAQELGVNILPAQMEETDDALLASKFRDLPPRVDPRNEEAFHSRLLSALEKAAVTACGREPAHNFLIGLAYLDGIDVEVDRKRARELITGAAENGLPEAMEKLIRMYTDGDGVPRDPASALSWSDRLAGHYFRECFPDGDDSPAPEPLRELFDHYRDPYWADAIRLFLLRADKTLADIRTLYREVLSLGIREYTLLLDACGEMTRHRCDTRQFLISDILEKSLDGTYPPYGPLFWYVPEYDLYETLSLCLEAVTDPETLAKGLALTRDVCFLYDRRTAMSQITDKVDGAALYARAEPALRGIRKELCRMFCLGETDPACGADVYPRCFNPAESASFARYGCGLYGKMTVPFSDELGLFSHLSYNEVDGEYIGFLSCPYSPEAEARLRQKSCAKLRGLALSDGADTVMGRFSLFGGRIRRIYLPENATDSTWEWDYRFGKASALVNRMGQKMYVSPQLLYPHDRPELPSDVFALCPYIEKVTFPREMQRVSSGAFYKCANLQQVTLHGGITHIGDHAFQECAALPGISLPDSLTQLGRYAFYGCKALNTLRLPDTLAVLEEAVLQECTALTTLELPRGCKQIGSGALTLCTSLTSLTLSDGLVSIGNWAFAECTALTQIAIPDSVTELKASALCHCTRLVSVKLPRRMTVLPDSLLAGCSSLETLRLPESTEIIGSDAFSGCTGLTSIELPDTLRLLGKGAFTDCYKLTAIRLGDRVSVLPSYCFARCPVLTEVTLPAALTAIGENAFDGCARLTRIRFPETLSRIDANAFRGCGELTEAALPDVTAVHPTAFARTVQITRIPTSGGLLTLGTPKNAKKIPAEAYKNREYLRAFTVGERVRLIGRSAFEGCIRLGSVELPEKTDTLGSRAFANCTDLRSASLSGIVTGIPHHLFSGCASLETVTLPPAFPGRHPSRLRQLLTRTKDRLSWTQIGSHAFEGCASLSAIRIPEGTDTLRAHAFRGCAALTEIVLPDSVTRIHNSVFEDCAALSEITLPPALNRIPFRAFRNCPSLTRITFPDGLQTVEPQAFSDCAALQELCLPASLQSLEAEAFSNCTALNRLTLPEGLSVLGENVFRDCRALTAVELPNGLKELRQGAFSGCAGLTRITLPEGLTHLGESVFSSCGSLTECSLPADLKDLPSGFFCRCTGLSKIVLPEGLASIGTAAFELCKGLTAVKLPESLTTIGGMAFCECAALRGIRLPDALTVIGGSAFLRCAALEDVRLPPALEVIEQYAFCECAALTRLEIPRSVQWIGKEAFAGCTGLRELVIPARFRPDLPALFSGVDLSAVEITFL